MDTNDDWLNFRERIIKMGEEPSEDIIEILEIMSGQRKATHKPIVQYEDTPLDKLIDEGVMYFQKVKEKIKTKKLINNNRHIIRLSK